MVFYTTIKETSKKSKNNDQDENIVDLFHDLPVNAKPKSANEAVSTSAITNQGILLRLHFRL